MDQFIIAQSVGVAATILALSVFQVNKRTSMLWLALAAGMLFTLHFWLLGAYTGAILNFVAAVRTYAFVKVNPSRKNIWMLWVSTLIGLVATIILWQGPLSLFAFAGYATSGIMFWQTKPKNIRLWGIVPSPFWFTYNAITHSYPGMFIEVVNVVSVLIGMYRFDRTSKSKIHHRLRITLH